MGDGNTNYIVCLSFPVSQSKFNWLCHVSQLLWETQKTPHILAQWNMIGYRLFASDPTGNLFYLHAAIFEISKQCSIMKPPASWGVDISIEIYISMHKQDHLKSSPFFFIFVSVVIRSLDYQWFWNFLPTDQYETVGISLAQLLHFSIQDFLHLNDWFFCPFVQESSWKSLLLIAHEFAGCI